MDHGLLYLGVTLFLFGLYYYWIALRVVWKSYTFGPDETQWSEFSQANRGLIVLAFVGLFFPAVAVVLGVYFRHVLVPRFEKAAHANADGAVKFYETATILEIVDGIDRVLSEMPDLARDPWIARNWLPLTDAEKQRWVSEREQSVRTQFAQAVKDGDKAPVGLVMMQIDKDHYRRITAPTDQNVPAT
ncbi:MAG: hypothetical protein ACK4FJ_06115 [Ferrovibrio sp.]|uniref:hypothetical protein n=1 Tax=Ferrovibrio sp. TaxID=1917215 RepID=UPI00391BEF43